MDFDAYFYNVELQSQARIFLNLKRSILRHLTESQTHLVLMDKKEKDLKDMKLKQNRNHEICLNLFRLRYNVIMQGDSYLNFEKKYSQQT